MPAQAYISLKLTEPGSLAPESTVPDWPNPALGMVGRCVALHGLS